ncbi:MAG: HIT domain-containing protein [Acidobacteriaceae bacterium]
MERLWTPWRLAYVSGESRDQRKGVPSALSGWPGQEDKGCVFCNMIAAVRWAAGTGIGLAEAERAALILEQGPSCFVCLNRYPYSTGHVLIVPYLHLASLADLPEEVAMEMMRTAQRMERALRRTYRPDGLNLGINMGEAAGAGIAEHIHLHELPRWSGDTNFMSSTAETRILPEELDVTWQKLRTLITEVQL